MEPITLQHDLSFAIACGTSASTKRWTNGQMSWSQFVNKIASPTITPETYATFMKASRQEQTKIKDSGGFVGGYLSRGSRDKGAILYRQLVCLDIDFSHSNFWWDFTMLYDCAACLHSTHKSCPAKPRHRLLIPLDREVSAEEYQAISRRIAGDLNIELFDASTFEVNRLMFWPTISCDAKYDFEYQDGPILNADSVLDRYLDWHDTSEWPSAKPFEEDIQDRAKKQEDPLSKGGIVGVFCRTYSIQEAIAFFLKDEYEQIEPNRYTYTKGSTAGGLVIYEDKFAYSHHGTDPASEKLCNAFDLVRVHKFGHLDAGKEKKDELKRPSYKAMETFASEDPKVRRRIGEERLQEAKFDFANTDEGVQELEEADNSWMEELVANAKGDYECTSNNINLILRNDIYLKGTFRLNIFDNKRYVIRSLPWRKVNEEGETLKDVDFAGVRNYIECVYGISSSQKVEDALALEVEKAQYHPIREYLASLEWDGEKRVDTLLIDYFGADDVPYTRGIMRLMLCAAIARVFEPGTKFDNALVLVGPQGTFKSTFLKRLGRHWFSDTFGTVQGKESFEQLQGAWLIEIAELSGFKKAEVETIKHYLSKSEDSFRPAYGRVVETYKRQCIFFGTTNSPEFLRDSSGNRRFLPVEVHAEKASKHVIRDLTSLEVDQIWAEAYQIYKDGEPLYLKASLNEAATAEQIKHTERDPRQGLIELYLDTLLPEDWGDKDLSERRVWLDSPFAKKGSVQRQYVCMAEIWCECLGRGRDEMGHQESKSLKDILRVLPGWAPSKVRRVPLYGTQRCYERIVKNDLL